jgi:hypothetical protein
MRGRRTTTLAAAVAVTLSLLAPSFAASDRLKPKKPRPNLGIAAVLGAPSEVLAGGRFAVKVLLGNAGDARTKSARLTLHLSRDPRKSAGDRIIGRAVAPALGPWKTRSKPVRAVVPGSTKRGIYYAIACVHVGKKDRCEAAPGGIEVVSPVDGVLTGKLNLFDSGSEGPKSWKRSTQLSISATVTGRGRDTKVVDNGSTYTWLGEATTTVTLPECTTTQSEQESEAAVKSAGWALRGSAQSADLSQLRLGIAMDYDVVGQITSCGSPQLPYVEVRETSMTIDLEKVSETASSITYRIAATWEAERVPSPWEDAQGTLTLKLK